MAKQLSRGSRSPRDPQLRAMPAERAAVVLETSHDYVNYRRTIGKKDVPDPSRLARELLVARSAIDAGPMAGSTVPTPEVRPDQGHGSSRVTLGAGRRAGERFQELRLRPTYHDILDAEEGYVRGAQIEFFSFTARHYEHGETRVEAFIPIDIVSLTPRDEFFEPWSWKIAAGWRRSFVRDGGEPLVGAIDGGAGAAWSAAGNRLLFYAMLDGSTRLHGRLEHGYSLGAGGHTGALVDLTPRWRLHAYARTLSYFLGEHDTPRTAALEQRLTLGRDLALRIDVSRNRQSRHTFNAASMSLMHYF